MTGPATAGIIPWTEKRADAVHEAAHASAAYLLGHRVNSVTVIPGRYGAGAVEWSPAPPGWNRACAEDSIAIRYAGPLAELAWGQAQPDAPGSLAKSVAEAAASDYDGAAELSKSLSSRRGEQQAARDWLRQRVLCWTEPGPGLDAHSPDGTPASSRRFWACTSALAAAVLDAGALDGRQARAVMRAADPAPHRGDGGPAPCP